MTNMFSDGILHRVVNKDPTMTRQLKAEYSIEVVNKFQALTDFRVYVFQVYYYY